jgi:hypothetical protein
MESQSPADAAPLARSTPPLCPSAHPEMAGSRVFGVMGGTAESPLLVYLDKPTPATREILDLAKPVKPTEVFRLAAPCVESQCCHFDGRDCRLVTRIVRILPAVTDTLPPCRIRHECRWFAQEAGAACQRCPQVITDNCSPSDQMVQAATPDLPAPVR